MSIMQSPSMGFVRRWVERPNPGSLGAIVHYEAPSITFEGLADLEAIADDNVDPYSGEIVVDLTGLKGRYQVRLDIPTADLAPDIRAGDYAAVQEGYLRIVQNALKKLGLQLDQRKALMDIVVIDHLEKTPSEN